MYVAVLEGHTVSGATLLLSKDALCSSVEAK
jgi:hypothetical protein